MLRFRDRVLRFRDLGASFSSFRCFVFEFWVLRFRVLGASFSSFGCFVFDLGCFVFEIWVLRASVFFLECFVFETTMFFTVFSHWMLKMKYSCYQQSSLIHGWFVY